MSKKQTQNTDQAPEKVVTKYDLKMQRRKEEKERAEKSRRRDSIIGIVIVAALIISIPFKVKFMKWWSKRQQERNKRGKWGDDE